MSGANQSVATVSIVTRGESTFAGLGDLISPSNWPEAGDTEQSPIARSLLANAERQAAEVYWYPGGGADLTPLLLMPENSLFQRKGFQPEKVSLSPLILWITDLAPVDRLLDDIQFISKPYGNLWQRLSADYRIASSFQIDLGIGGPPGQHYILDAEIVRAGSQSQRFRFLYSQSNVEAFPEFFAARRVKIGWIAFIKATGGFGGPSSRLIMKDLSAHYPPWEMPDAIIGDKNFSSEGWPGYTRLGSRSAGWLPRSQLRPDKRLKTGGVAGWGAYHSHDWSNAAFWPRDDLYDQFVSIAGVAS